jgi:hypothetical protein
MVSALERGGGGGGEYKGTPARLLPYHDTHGG